MRYTRFRNVTIMSVVPNSDSGICRVDGVSNSAEPAQLNRAQN